MRRGRLGGSDFRFTRRDVRAFTGWSHDQVGVHLDRLVSLEYVLVHRGGRGQSFVYELLYDGEGKDGQPFLPGLIGAGTTATSAGKETTSADEEETLAGGFGPLSRADRGPLAGTRNGSEAAPHTAFGELVVADALSAPLGSPASIASYPRLVMKRAAGSL